MAVSTKPPPGDEKSPRRLESAGDIVPASTKESSTLNKEDSLVQPNIEKPEDPPEKSKGRPADYFVSLNPIGALW